MKKLKRYQYERYAVLCRLSYPRIFRQTRYGFDPNGQRVIKNRSGKILIRVLWSTAREEVVVVVKGSHSLMDWLINCAFWFRSCRKYQLNYSIHAGFYYQLNQESMPSHRNDKLGLTVWERVESVLAPLLTEGKKVTFTGHSSGGAMACVLADYTEQKHPRSVKRVVTFGQPAVGGWAFKKEYGLNHKTYRICCDIDIITFMPPAPLIYWHTGKMLWLYNGRIYENTPSVLRLSRSLLSWLIRPFSYHMMSKYIRDKDFFDER